MLVIRTVCGNGIGSSLMAANNVKKICEELGIKADVASVDFANAVGEKSRSLHHDQRTGKSISNPLSCRHHSQLCP